MYTMVIRLINNVLTVLWPRIKYETSRDETEKLPKTGYNWNSHTAYGVLL